MIINSAVEWTLRSETGESLEKKIVELECANGIIADLKNKKKIATHSTRECHIK